MKNLLVLLIGSLLSLSVYANDPFPEVLQADIEYPSPKAAYEALKQKPEVTFSSSDDGWIAAYEKEKGTIWTFAPSSHPSFPLVVKRVVIEEQGQLFIKMAVKCGGSKVACDDIVRTFNSMNEQMVGEAKAKAKEAATIGK